MFLDQQPLLEKLPLPPLEDSALLLLSLQEVLVLPLLLQHQEHLALILLLVPQQQPL